MGSGGAVYLRSAGHALSSIGRRCLTMSFGGTGKFVPSGVAGGGAARHLTSPQWRIQGAGGGRPLSDRLLINFGRPPPLSDFFSDTTATNFFSKITELPVSLRSADSFFISQVVPA